ncbi:GNAT family N-acetyltransferase [Mesorhizobium sp. NBSH29]|uniref:GNAT family N-acetyltransferase n=1 Tax=Mesorhizobium sp. NBSH29 TaxID=2654249 RepID=UPI001896A4E5|nr:GNAT family N-acetyltransferase [Mesorhizobium sp. NBSH29]QPC88584.1 GNAT family N-acetyltransferase [Mesorhizobium sp. NBSH29]
MRLPFLSPRKRDYVILPLARSHSAALAALHRDDFSRPWSANEFDDLLAQHTVFGFAAFEAGKGKSGPVGFALARLAADEAEILTITVSRAHRRQGLGRQMMDAVLRRLHTARAEALFLEVDETNAPAIALYLRLAFHEVGKRPAYYQGPDNRKANALVMRRDLR